MYWEAAQPCLQGCATGRDATFAWNYVDLRFRPDHTLRLSASLKRDELVLCVHGAGSGRAPSDVGATGLATARSCGTCAETGCFRHGAALSAPAGRQAFLVDEAWPEFRDHGLTVRHGGGSLGLPLQGRLARRSSWPTAGFGPVRAAPLAALMRSLAMRCAPQGAARRLAALATRVPVLATAACGLDGPSVTTVAALDAPGLTDAPRLVLR